jgi:hypothetical protein
MTPPPGDRQQVEKVWRALEEQATLTHSLSGAGLRGDTEAITELFQEAERQAQRLDGLTDGYGFKDC